MTTLSSQGKTRAIEIHADGVRYRDLNALIREAVEKGAEHIDLRDVHGQRYIGTNLRAAVDIDIYGTPGNDLGAFMNGSRIIVHGNAQDGCGNTMDEGEIIVHGHAGDITGLSARGGKIFVREGVGYRAGIHMKEYREKKPALVVGGTAQDFLGEYMAGGIVIVLGIGLAEGEPHRASFVGTGMHGGVIYLRGHINDYQLGKEVGVAKPDKKDREVLSSLVRQFAAYFDYDAKELLSGRFIKLFPLYLRPYGRLYAP
jgi:glutamate synthase domain-containing protein 3